MRRSITGLALACCVVLCVGAKPQKKFERIEEFPRGEQTRALVGSFLSGLKDVNAEAAVFGAPLNDVWPAAKRAAERFSADSGRSVVGIDEQARRIQSGKITQDTMIGMGAGAWIDEFRIEVRELGPSSTQVSVTRKVVQREFTGERPWRTQLSNGKVERWILTQIDDELKQPAATDLVASQGQTSAAAAEKQEEPGSPATAPQQPELLTNEEVVRLVQAKVPDMIITAKIRAAACRFDTTTDGLIALKRAGVSDVVLQAMTLAPGRQ